MALTDEGFWKLSEKACVANGDGLFPGMSQTYRLVEGA